MTIVRNRCVVYDQMGDGCKRVLPTDVTVVLTAAVTQRVRLLSAFYFLCVYYNQVVLKLLVTKRNGAFRVLKVILQSAW